MGYPVAKPKLEGNERKYVLDCLDTGWISSNGKYVEKFEKQFAAWVGTKHAASCCNGTVAVHLPLLAIGIGPQDEVLVPSFTYIATANAVRYCGAKPVFVDCLRDTWNMDPEDARKKITKNTKAIIPVHLYGNPCDMDPIMDLAREHDLVVIEDVAECHGGTYKGRQVGGIGDFGSYSFFGNKIITTGEGGMVTCNDDKYDERIRSLKGQGMSKEKRFWFDIIGYNYRMTNIEAAIGLGQLENINELIGMRKNVAKWYMEELSDAKDYLEFQKVTPEAESVWWMFSILVKGNTIERDELAKSLNDIGIETRPLFYPMHMLPVYKDEDAGCSVSEDISSRGLNLPTYADLSREDVKKISGVIKNLIIQ